MADKIRQRHNGAIKKNQRSSPERKKGLLIIAETWVNIVPSIKKKLKKIIFSSQLFGSHSECVMMRHTEKWASFMSIAENPAEARLEQG